MDRFKETLRRHALAVGLLAVAIPLLASLWLQYRSLSKLESTLPTARRAYMRQYLSEVIDRVTACYEQKAEETLGVPSSAFHHEYPNKDFKENAMDREQISAYFRQHKFKGARLLFTGVIAGMEVPNYALVAFYDPVSCSYHYKHDESEFQSAHAAAANWISMTMTNAIPKSPHLTVDERDHKLCFANQPFEGPNYDVVAPMPFIFTDCLLGARMRGLTAEEWSRKHFSANLTLSILTALAL